jgi:DNA-3-methyladenine glycosylase
MHWQFNVVTGSIGEPHAVLIRAVEPVAGIELMAKRRRMSATQRELTNGPGKLCAAFDIGAEAYGVDLCRGSLFLAEDPEPRARRVLRSPRVGVDYAGAWAKKPWRFTEALNPWVSRPPKGSLKNG